MGEMPLDLRRDQLSLVFWANLRGHREDHLSQSTLVESQERQNGMKSSFGWTVKQKAYEMEIASLDISPTVVISRTPIWTLEDLSIDLNLLEEAQKEDIDSNVVQRYLRERYGDRIIIYTDGSKREARVGVAFVIPKLKIASQKRINDNLAVYTAELVAIVLALSWAESNKPRSLVIASDSASALISIQNINSQSRQDIVIEIVQMASKLIKDGVKVGCVWIPAHKGVVGNELADKNAKEATELENINLSINYSKAEVKSIIKGKIKEKWQVMWDNGHSGRKLYSIQKIVGENWFNKDNLSVGTIVFRPTLHFRRWQ
nr:uncharacterized protein LOC129419084 isoform X2 [Misgurnus anguillicaudatus]